MPDMALRAPVLEPALVVVEGPFALHPLLLHAIGPVGYHPEDRDDSRGLPGARISSLTGEDLEGDGAAVNGVRS